MSPGGGRGTGRYRPMLWGMSLRAPLTALGLAVASVLSLAVVPAAAAAPDPTLVRVDAGLLRGESAGDVVRFRGVPYARPPVGELRWRPPRPPQPWSGVRDATIPGRRCAQPAGGGEDCLYADITRPLRPGRGGRLPVLVWIHGGGLTTGSGSDYDAARLAAAGDMVVVSVNYRLGALGFLSHPALDDRGTVSGNSCAGAADVATCLRRAPAADLLDALKDVEAPVTGTAADDPWGPVAGTPFLPRQPATALRHGSAAGIPLLIGSTRDEMRSFVPYTYDLGGDPLTAQRYADVVTDAFGDDAPAVLRRYPAAGDPSPVLALSRVLTDWGGRIGACPTLATATLAARHAPVYAYEMAQDGGTVIDGFPFGAHHGSDLPYLFDLPWADPGPRGLTAAMTGYWTTFAHRGDPHRAGPPAWHPVRADRRTDNGATVLGLTDGAITPTPFAADHRCRFWAGR